MTIRAHLLLLAAFAVLPVLVFAVLISIMLIDHQQRTFEQGAIERSRAMMSAVDADLRGSLSTLNALGASRALAADDLSGFHDSAVRVRGFTSRSAVSRVSGSSAPETGTAPATGGIGRAYGLILR